MWKNYFIDLLNSDKTENFVMNHAIWLTTRSNSSEEPIYEEILEGILSLKNKSIPAELVKNDGKTLFETIYTLIIECGDRRRFRKIEKWTFSAQFIKRETELAVAITEKLVF